MAARQHVSRAVTFGPALVLPAWAWTALREPWHWAGLALLVTLSLWIIPGMIVLAIFFVPHRGAALVPRSWRKRYRRYRGPRDTQRSARIPESLRRVTFAADRHRCVYCRKRCLRGELQVDHYCPWSQGGSTTAWNVQSLCAYHNRVKSNYWPGGFYRPFDAHDDIRLAAAILAAERRHRWNPLRLTRAAWALGA
jgi:hypothetical protein